MIALGVPVTLTCTSNAGMKRKPPTRKVAVAHKAELRRRLRDLGRPMKLREPEHFALQIRCLLIVVVYMWSKAASSRTIRKDSRTHREVSTVQTQEMFDIPVYTFLTLDRYEPYFMKYGYT